jgi:very-short-patch-repair endonuclease
MIGDNKEIGLVIKQSWREKIRAHARELRRNQTPSEKILWDILRDRKLSGKKFTRQHPIIHFTDRRPYYFVADFYCHEMKLVIELDGRIHDQIVEYDDQRTYILNETGITVIRIRNEELNDPKSLIDKIKTYLYKVPTSPSLPKRGGRGVSS